MPHHHHPHQTESWFMAMSEFCSNMATNLFVQLTSCIRIPEDYSVELAAYHASLRGLSLENRDSMGLLAATFTGRESKARELLALPWTNINAQYANGNTPLILAVQGQNERLVRLLLEHPCINVNLRGLDGYTALIRACASDRPEMVGLLLTRADTDVNLATYYGSTALTYAIRCGNEEAVQLLLMRRDLEVNFQSRHGENALLEAVSYQRYDIARALINRGDVEVDVVDGRDRTPLIMSVQHGCATLTRLLLFAGADACAEDDHGRNALYYALKRSSSSSNSFGGSANYSHSSCSSSEIVHDLLEALSQPQSLMRLCRTVIRRTIRDKLGGSGGQRLKPAIDRFQRYEVPRTLKKFLAYDP